MRIRKEFAAAFAFLLAASAFAGLNHKESTFNPGQYTTVVPHGDKGLHFLTFFLLTGSFYWIFETSRRRAINLTLICITAVLGVGSEFLQGILPIGREFDYFDILANIVGSSAALSICAWYHRRMLERRRTARYGSLSGDEATGIDSSQDIELGSNLGPQESGVTTSHNETSIDDELDNWDENVADDWAEEDEHVANGTVDSNPPKAVALDETGKSKRDE